MRVFFKTELSYYKGKFPSKTMTEPPKMGEFIEVPPENSRQLISYGFPNGLKVLSVIQNRSSVTCGLGYSEEARTAEIEFKKRHDTKKQKQ